MIMDLNVGLSFFGAPPRQISASPLSEAPIVIRRRRTASSPANPLPDVSSSMDPNDSSSVRSASFDPPPDMALMSSSILASASAAVGKVPPGSALSSRRFSSSSSPLGSSEYSASFPASSSSSSSSPSSSSSTSFATSFATSASTSAITSAPSSVSSTNSYGSAGFALRDPMIRGATRTVPFMYV